MKLEIKHLAPYFPYKLQVNVKLREDSELPYYLSEDGIYTLDGLMLDWYPNEVKEIKPILRPLSDLTKEIEVNGKKFIPMFELFNIEYKGTHHVEDIRKMYTDSTGRFLFSSHYGTAQQTSFNILSINNNNHWKIEKLHEWHFDTKKFNRKRISN